MAELTWDGSERPYYEGVDHAVLYLPTEGAIPWNGLVSVEEKTNADDRPIYLEGRKVGNVFDSDDFECTVTAFTYPEEFGKYTGFANYESSGSRYDVAHYDSATYSPESVSGQYRRYFGMSYRTGDAKTGQLHLVYNAIARPTKRGWRTGKNPELSLFEWGITTRPITLTGFRPTSHLVVDIASTTTRAMGEIRAALYGSVSTEARLPSLQDMYNILQGTATFQVTDNEDGTWTVDALDNSVVILGDGRAQITSSSVVAIDSTSYSMTTRF